MFSTTQTWGTNWMIGIHLGFGGEPSITIMSVIPEKEGAEKVGQIVYSGTLEKLAKDLGLA